jgi:methylmalonyl-CoA/ethylmalonyl-CoA epimerase
MSEPLPELQLDHIGVQVRALEPAIRQFEQLFGYRQATEPVTNTRQQVRVVFLEKPGSIPLKLICPVDVTTPSAPKLHHLAFRTDVLARGVEALCARGARLLSPPTPGEAFDDEPIAFLFAAGLNIELIATDKRRQRLPVEPDEC